jgi:seryl-tRNA synthetase
MLDFIPKSKEELEENLKKRGYSLDLVDEFFSTKEKRAKLKNKLDSLRSQQNKLAKEFASLKREKSESQLEIMKKAGEEVKEEIKRLNSEIKELEIKYQRLLLSLPNTIADSVPEGMSDEENRVIRYWGERPKFDFEVKPHWEIGKRLHLLDFERAAKMSGSRFVIYTQEGALIERALINFMLDLHTREHKYKEIFTPFMVKKKSMENTGQLPKFADELFFCEPDYYLIPTAEVTLVNLHQDEILEEDELPLSYTAYSACFRAEAGSWGKDTRGIMRQHQFNKVELVKFTTPETSDEALEELVRHAEEVLRRLNLHYRVVELCSGNLAFSSYKTYDLEVWIPSEERYREISSCSNCLDFQAWRGNIRLKRKGKKKLEYLHTLNASGVAVGRTFLAILENFQTKEGGVILPKALLTYTHGLEMLSPP